MQHNLLVHNFPGRPHGTTHSCRWSPVRPHGTTHSCRGSKHALMAQQIHTDALCAFSWHNPLMQMV
eukprot:1161865-Pelagomonas_calceolata.AAC.20